MKKNHFDDLAIVLSAFGTSRSEALNAYRNLEKVMAQRFAGATIGWAYASATIRKILAKKGVAVDSPDQALEKLARQGRKKVAVQALYMIPGYEHNELQKTVCSWEARFEQLVLGAPLINSHHDAETISDRILDYTPERRSGEILVLMGHGSAHAGGLFYTAMNALFNEKDTLAFVGAVEGQPGLEKIVGQCQKLAERRLLLLPFMVVAGEHARIDMGGGQPDSWLSTFRKKGFDARAVYRGLAENHWSAHLFADHLKTALEHNSAKEKQT